MGFNQSSATSNAGSTARSTVFSRELFSDVISGCLAGFGIWTKPSPSSKTDTMTTSPVTASNIYPLRVIRVKDANPHITATANSPKMAGRMVISGRMADVCAELDRLAA